MMDGVFSQNTNVELGSLSASTSITSHKGLWGRERPNGGYYHVNQFSGISGVNISIVQLCGWTSAYDGWDESEADQSSGWCFGGIKQVTSKN